MSWFWIIGIFANVTLTVLAIVWVLRQGKARSAQIDEGRQPGPTTVMTSGGSSQDNSK